LFNTGDVLTAAQVNNYLQEQVIMVFANSSARTSALSGVLAEGMASYLQDTNSFEIYNGSAWVSASGDLTGLTAGTGITITDPTGPVPTITNDVATEFDTKGDLIVGTGADTFDKLVAGSNGETLVADSAATTGLRYIPYGSINYAVNGGMDIWQRGTSTTNVSSSAPYVADRWYAYTGATAFNYTRETPSLEGFQYCLRVQRPSGGTGTTAAGGQVRQVVETANSVPLANKLITLSFWARKGANYSSASDALTISSSQGTGTDTGKHDTFTSGTALFSGTATLTTSWQRFSFSTTAASTTTQISIGFSYTPVGTAGAADYYEVTGVQLEIGGTATAFRRAGGTLQGELAACQRYLPAFTVTDQFMGMATTTTDARYSIKLPVTARVAPTGITTTAANLLVQNKSLSSAAPLSASFVFAGTNMATIGTNTTAGSPTLATGEIANLFINTSGSILFTGCEL
jgi:hypothetical protein